MSLWEFNQIVRGKIAASGDGAEGGAARPPSEEEFFAAVEQTMK